MALSFKQPTLQNVELALVKSHPDLQRPVNEGWVKRIMRAWNSDAFGVPIVAPIVDQPGWFWCVAGQHRMEAARRLGMTYVVCQVMSDSSEEAMARAYIDEQAQREQHPLVKHRIAVAANDPTAVGVQNTCDECGYRIPSTAATRSASSGTIQAMKPAYQLFERGQLRTALTIIDLAFGKDNLACQGWFLGALSTFLLHVDRCMKSNTCAYSQDVLVSALRRDGIAQIYGRYAARKTVDTIVATMIGAGVLVDAYNKGRRVSRIPMIDVRIVEKAA